LSKTGLTVRDIDLPAVFKGIDRVFGIISNVEGVRAMEAEFRDHLDTMNHWLRDLAASKETWTDDDYEKALASANEARTALGRIFDKVDILLTPSSAGEAPADLESASVSPFNRIWTLMHGPTITLPSGEGPSGMPIGLQLVARPGHDASLIAHARQIWSLLMAERT
jgi:Asp-tRNA(Asn)/Glu-tRNA(Gln) amidotransferase A subunit family amidase